MKVPSLIEDNFIPMEIEDEKALQEQKRKRNEHWWRMRMARSEWMKLTGYTKDIVDPSFWEWLKYHYGLVPDRDHNGNITEGFAITDEKLYTIFLLKFGQ